MEDGLQEAKQRLVREKFSSSTTEITMYDKAQWHWPWRGKTNSKDTDGMEMTWLYDLLDMETNGEVWDNFQVFDLGNWMDLSASDMIRVTGGGLDHE